MSWREEFGTWKLKEGGELDENVVAEVLLGIRSISTVSEIAKRLSLSLTLVAADVAAEVQSVELVAEGLDNVCTGYLPAAGQMVVQQEQAAAWLAHFH